MYAKPHKGRQRLEDCSNLQTWKQNPAYYSIVEPNFEFAMQVWDLHHFLSIVIFDFLAYDRRPYLDTLKLKA